MRILITGNDGLIGHALAERLQENNHEIVEFDLTKHNDIRDITAVINAGTDCDVVVHLAALLGNNVTESAEDIIRTNLLGTWNVLESARINSFHKVIFMSSVDALGLFKGEGIPDYFPIDDDHPCRPRTSYAISKKIAEEMCQSFTHITNIPTVCLRPPGVWDQQTYFNIIKARRRRPEYEWDPYWEYGAFIDLRDLINVIIKCLDTNIKGHNCYIVASDDITTSGDSSMTLVNKIHPKVKWKNQDDYKNDPYRSLLDCHRAKVTFGWKPQFTWKKFIEENVINVPENK